MNTHSLTLEAVINELSSPLGKTYYPQGNGHIRDLQCSRICRILIKLHDQYNTTLPLLVAVN